MPAVAVIQQLTLPVDERRRALGRPHTPHAIRDAHVVRIDWQIHVIFSVYTPYCGVAHQRNTAVF
jgi:hypothetical protein